MDIPGITIQIPQANQTVKPQDTAKSFQDVLQQTSSQAGMDNTISTQKTAEVKQDLPVEKTRDTQLTKVLSSVVSGQGKMDKIIKLATSGRTFNPTELLAIQRVLPRRMPAEFSRPERSPGNSVSRLVEA